MHQKRLKAVTENMKRRGLPQILVSSTASVYYLTGLWIEPMERLLVLYIRDNGECALFGNALFGLTPGGDVPLYIHTDADDPLTDLAKVVRSGVLGVDKSWPSCHLLSLMKQRPDVTPKLGSAPVDEARMLKDEKEIKALRSASRINDEVMEASLKAVREGAVEKEMAAFVEHQFALHGADRATEGMITSFGPNCADPHHSPDNTLVKRGDSMVFDIYIPIQRYWCDMTRTVFFKEISDGDRRIYETVLKANLAAEAMIRPGVMMCDIDRTARQVIEDAGYGPYFTHRLGHGLGIDCHEPPDNGASCQMLAQAGMVFSVEPGIYLPGKMGVRIEDLVLVTPDGCEVLNHYTKDLQVLCK
ncbi:M24 family metallopeptidase [Caproicibacterium lactatifermentans]|uniref:M24 family metallopeptidase n=1 Tax=Caproicibacterium lactatifermentans TaxID=2666138 RepID=A0A859DTH6_9FIRM|nr:M24 family metallopeptidase [Caproicibacterium lactatifermentans]QKO31212.1 M24 family metallopeptidase [Caproicibacterium lactatifermentans]